MRWRTTIWLTCGCSQRYLQDGGRLPDPGEEAECGTHGTVEIDRSWRVSR